MELIKELLALGLVCKCILNDELIIEGEFSDREEAILAAVIACHGKIFSSPEKNDLWDLLTNDQKDAYIEVRDDEAIEQRIQEHLKSENLNILIGYLSDLYAKKDFTDLCNNIAVQYPLWSNT